MRDNQASQRKPLTDYHRQQAFELHATGMSYRKIARALGYKSDSTIRALFVPKKPKPIATTLPAKPKLKSSKTPSVLHHVRSVPMLRRRQHPPLDHIPTKDELYAILHQAVKNTQC